jgi:tetratricopeptide (TPR) repeat protein
LQRALEIRTRSFGPSHSDVASTIDDLTTLYRAQGRRIEAESLGEGLLAAQRPAPAQPKPPHPAPAQPAPAQPAPAQPAPAPAQPIREQSKAEEPKPPVAPPREVVANPVDRPAVVAPQRQVAPAPPTRAVTTPNSDTRKGDRPDGEELTRVLREIAGLRGAEAEPASAQQLYRRALAMMEATGATDRPELRTALRELGRLYYRQGAYAEAEPLLERALALARRAGKAAEVAEISDDLAWLRFSRRSLTER